MVAVATARLESRQPRSPSGGKERSTMAESSTSGRALPALRNATPVQRGPMCVSVSSLVFTQLDQDH